MGIQIEFRGVRGSVAAPGAATREVGGNTSCVEVRAGGQSFGLDAGTGLRALGDALLARGERCFALLLSHHHWDHIQGLPFFAPAYVPGFALDVYGPTAEGLGLRGVLEHQMQAPVFPVSLAQLGARLGVHEIVDREVLEFGDVIVRVAALDHPGGVFGYRIEHAGASVVYATDVEYGGARSAVLLELARGADALIYDAQYTPEEYRGDVGPSKRGWGHSTYEEGVRIAEAAGVGELLLFHHDPRRDDAAVAAIEARAQALFPRARAAREGMVLHYGVEAPPESRRAA